MTILLDTESNVKPIIQNGHDIEGQLFEPETQIFVIATQLSFEKFNKPPTVQENTKRQNEAGFAQEGKN